MPNQTILQKIQDFFHGYPKVEFAPKDLVIRPWDEIKDIYFLEKGEVKQYTTTLKGEEIVHHIFSAGSYFPMMLLLSKTVNRYYFETFSDSFVYRAPAEDVLKFVKGDIDICFDLATRFATGLSKFMLKIESTEYKDSYYKVLTVLIYLAEKFGRKTDIGLSITLPLMHTDIASWAGIQRETASRQLGHLSEKEIITYENHIITVDMDKLLKEEKEYKYYLAKK